MANIKLYKSRAWAFFASSHIVLDIKYYDFKKYCDLENISKCHDGDGDGDGAVQWLVPDFLYDDNINVCTISYHLRDICKNIKIATVLTLKMKVKVKY